MNLDDMLKDQDKIEDKGFSAQVMSRIPKKRKSKRSFILGTCLAIGSVTSFYFLTDRNSLTNLFNSPALPFAIVALAITICMGSLLYVANEELFS